MAKIEGQELQNRLFKQIDDSYRKARAAEMESLHNELVKAISAQSPSPQNLLLVLELLKQETLNDCIAKFFGAKQVKDRCSEAKDGV